MRSMAGAVVLAMVVIATRVATAAPTDPLLACQRALARAGRALGDHLRHEIGGCLRLGVACLTGDAADVVACCDAAAARCRPRAIKVAKAKRHYMARLRAGRCGRLRFDVLTSADGLGFERVVQTCGCVEPDADIHNLASLAMCLARLTEVETTRLLATTESPRAIEALTCVSLDDELGALERSTICAQSSPTPTVAVTMTANPSATQGATMTATPLPARTATATPAPTATTLVTPARTITPNPTPTPLPTSTPRAVCGNGIVEGDEECDGTAFDATACAEDVCTCEDFCDDAGGRLACHRNCTIDFGRCTAGGCEF
jgi:hypothetical protein